MRVDGCCEVENEGHGIQEPGGPTCLHDELGRVDKQAALRQHIGIDVFVGADADDAAVCSRADGIELGPGQGTEAADGGILAEVKCEFDAFFRALEKGAGVHFRCGLARCGDGHGGSKMCGDSLERRGGNRGTLGTSCQLGCLQHCVMDMRCCCVRDTLCLHVPHAPSTYICVCC